MIRTRKPYRWITLLAIASSAAWAQSPGNPFDVLPYRAPQALQQLADLDDARFAASLENGGAFFSTVAAYDPPGISIFPVSHGFAGPRRTCLNLRVVEACRLYVSDLLAVLRDKEDRGIAPASANVPAAPGNPGR